MKEKTFEKILVSDDADDINDDIDFLVENGLDINVRDQYGRTALMYALETKKSPKVIHKLLDLGADINAKNNGKITVLNYAVKYEDENIIQRIIDLGANLNERNGLGYTALMFASEYITNVKIITKLIELGSDVNAIGSIDKETVLMHAARNNTNPDVISKLIEHGAHINKKDAHLNETALWIAIENNSNLEVISKLIELGADINERNFLGQTPIMYLEDQIKRMNKILKILKSAKKIQNSH
ncbi:MAG: ankyrin repeat domain-containing protein [Alphaproteobacteria bacterium]|nr:ankyrin repeat domain-containing protein [Alphaproteobacteria bacterium]